MNTRDQFYGDVVEELIPNKNASILVCGGGSLDRDTLGKTGFCEVTISNLDSRMDGKAYAPYAWSYQNAEALSFADASFDYVIIHAAIHHASSPHRVLTEMYRVAKKGVLAFESRDSLSMRLLEKLGAVQTYEHAAVYYNDCQFGGVNNSAIPNYIYRWTEREVEKTINTYAPLFRHHYLYRYGTDFPCTPELENNSRLKYRLLQLLRPGFWLFTRIFPKQQNLMAFYVAKPDPDEELHPWLVYDKASNEIHFRRAWGDSRYRKEEN